MIWATSSRGVVVAVVVVEQEEDYKNMESAAGLWTGSPLRRFLCHAEKYMFVHTYAMQPCVETT